MKRHELRQLIKESVKAALNENFLTESPKDPTKEEMVQFLRKEFGGMGVDEQSFEFDMEGAIYWFASHYHGGQWSNLYSALSTSQFSPGPSARGPERDSMEEDMYRALEAEFGGQEHQHGTEPPHPGEDEEWSTALQERTETVLKYLDNGYYILSPKQAKEFSVDGQLPRPGYEKKADISKLQGLKADYRGQIRPLDVSEEDSAWIHQTPTWGKNVWAVRIHKRNIPIMRESRMDDPNYGDEFATDNSLLSTCCQAPPMGEVDRIVEPPVGICSRCRDHASFEPAELQEDGAAGGQGGPGAPGTGMGNVTANVDPVRVPFGGGRKHPKDVPAHRTDEASAEDDDALYVEYLAQMPGEEPFMLNGQKFEYVWAKYPSGKKDIGVYAFAGDMTYGYNAFRQMHNLKESEITDPSTGEVAPGPRDRFEMQPGTVDWETKAREREKKERNIGRPQIKKALDKIALMPQHQWRALMDRARKAHRFFPNDGSDPVKLNTQLALQYISENPGMFAETPLRESYVPTQVLKLKDLLK